MKLFASALALAVVAMANPAQAQDRLQVQTRTPPPPRGQSFQAPEIDPVIERLASLEAELAALKESAGKQVVVLHFTPSELPGWLDNNFAQNEERAAELCQQALGDRYGRVLSRRNWTNGERFFFTHVVCETAP